MTNEEKARELINEYDFWHYRDRYCSVKSAIKMAEWKDDYFKKVLEDKLSFFEEAYKKSLSEYMGGACDGIRCVLNVLFSEKK